MLYLVDTHTLLWFVYDDPRLSPRAAELLAKGEGIVLSVVSLWEIAVKLTVDKLRLGTSYSEFVEGCVTGRNIDLLSLELPHLAEYVELPMHHRDPFDRLLIAQSRAERLTIVTADPRFRAYDTEIAW